MKTCMMKRIRKTIKANVVAFDGQVVIRFPKQLLQNIAIQFGGKIIKQWEVFILGDSLKVEVVK